MITNIKTQKIYTFPDIKLYGEFCATGILHLRLQIIKGEIKEELCFLDENDRAYCFNEFGIPEQFPSSYIETIQTSLLKDILYAQMQKRLNKKDE